MAVTLQDIAKELDLSANTVSRSLRHDSAINPGTRARVNETARRLGYKGGVGRPRRAVTPEAKNNALGLLVRHNNLDVMQYDVNLMKMMAGLMSVTDKCGMHLKVHTLPFAETRHLDEESDLTPPMIEDGSCKALIVHGAHDDRDLLFLTHRLPVVSLTRIYMELPIDAAVADNSYGIQGLVAHLAGLGHRRLAWVGVQYPANFMDAREAGFIQGCRHHGLKLDQQAFFGAEIYRGTQIKDPQALLNAVEAGVTGFVCGNDGTALKVIHILEAAGLRVPDDVSVTGFDAEAKMDPLYPKPLTTIDPGFFEIGQVAARLALQRIAHPLSKTCITSVRSDFVKGESTGPAPEKAIAP